MTFTGLDFRVAGRLKDFKVRETSGAMAAAAFLVEVQEAGTDRSRYYLVC
jgi:hypothetical protein